MGAFYYEEKIAKLENRADDLVKEQDDALYADDKELYKQLCEEEEEIDKEIERLREEADNEMKNKMKIYREQNEKKQKEKKEWYCDVCKVEINKKNKAVHLRSKKHKDKENEDNIYIRPINIKNIKKWSPETLYKYLDISEKNVERCLDKIEVFKRTIYRKHGAPPIPDGIKNETKHKISVLEDKLNDAKKIDKIIYDKIRLSKPSSKGLITIKCDDDKSFLWCHVRCINPQDKDPQRINKTDKKLAKSLNYNGIDFSGIQYDKVEDQNNINVNVYGYKYCEYYPIYSSKKKNSTVLNLLLHKGQYVLIKDVKVLS